MEHFVCPVCHTRVHFDSTVCEACGSALAYEPGTDGFVAAADGTCANRSGVEACNWAAETDTWCRSCALDVDHDATSLRRPFQMAKRRVLRQFARAAVDPASAPPARFDMREGTAEHPVTTGHADGLITLDTSEGDETELTAVRESLGEPYRTPLGHVRHELGHWYWQSHLGITFPVEGFRELFGDERADYADALRAHYGSVDDGSWRERHISFYAAAHPWEDFAESFAHALHMLDTSETARANGVGPGNTIEATLADFDRAYGDWVDLTVVVNELNRSMGTPDAYPFAVSPVAVDKIRFVVSALSRGRATTDGSATA